MVLMGPMTPSLSGVMPGRAFFSIARACSGISGRDQASGAGDRVVGVGSAGHLGNGDGDLLGQGRAVQEPLALSARDCSTRLAWALPALAFSSTSWKSKTSAGCGEALGGKRSQGRIVQQVDQRLNVVTTLHGARAARRLRQQSGWESGPRPWRRR